MSDAIAVFNFGEFGGTDHRAGDPNCEDCWIGYPQRCHCGGLIHSNFGDEDWDGDYWLETKCDKCGEPG